MKWEIYSYKRTAFLILSWRDKRSKGQNNKLVFYMDLSIILQKSMILGDKGFQLRTRKVGFKMLKIMIHKKTMFYGFRLMRWNHLFIYR